MSLSRNLSWLKCRKWLSLIPMPHGWNSCVDVCRSTGHWHIEQNPHPWWTLAVTHSWQPCPFQLPKSAQAGTWLIWSRLSSSKSWHSSPTEAVLATSTLLEKVEARVKRAADKEAMVLVAAVARV